MSEQPAGSPPTPDNKPARKGAPPPPGVITRNLKLLGLGLFVWSL